MGLDTVVLGAMRDSKQLLIIRELLEIELSKDLSDERNLRFVKLCSYYAKMLGLEQELTGNALVDFAGFNQDYAGEAVSDIWDSAHYWEVQSPGVVHQYRLQLGTNPATITALGKPVVHEVVDARQLLEEKLERESRGELVVVTGLPMVGVLWPPMDSSKRRRKFRGKDSLYQEMNEKVLGHTPPYFLPPVQDFSRK